MYDIVIKFCTNVRFIGLGTVEEKRRYKKQIVLQGDYVIIYYPFIRIIQIKAI